MDNNEVEEKKNSSKQILLSVIGVAILIVAVVGVSFAAFTYSKRGDVVNTISTGTISMTYTEAENGINITDAVPMTETEGMALTGTNNVFDFTVSAKIVGDTTINYTIAAEQANVYSTTTPASAEASSAKIMYDATTTMYDYCNSLVVGGIVDTNAVSETYSNGKGSVISAADYAALPETTDEEKAAKAAYTNNKWAQCTIIPNEFVNLNLRSLSDNTETATEGDAMSTKHYADTAALTNTGKPEGTMELLTSSFTASGSTEQNNYYRLRMWVDTAYPVDGVSRSFKVRVNVYGKGTN